MRLYVLEMVENEVNVSHHGRKRFILTSCFKYASSIICVSCGS